MRLISVNVSLPGQIQNRGKSVTTGIFKEPVKDRIMLRSLNLEGEGRRIS
jgi:MOSC domain-containing protein YiiM